MRRFLLSTVWIFLLLSLLLGGKDFVKPAWAEPDPLAVIQAGTQQMLAIFKTCQPPEICKTPSYREAIIKIIANHCDFEEMSRRALGRYWEQQSPEKKREFVRLFGTLFCNTYLDRIDASACTNIEVLFLEEKVEDQYAYVRTQINGPRERGIAVGYRLRLVNQEWRVYDVVVEGISYISNYRSQFGSLLTAGSFDDLLMRLRQKVSA